MRRLALGQFGAKIGLDQESRIARIEAALSEVELASHEGSVGDLPSTLVDPNADKPLFWSDKKKEFKFLNSGTGIKVDSDNNGEGNLSLDLNEGTGIDISGNTISIDLEAGPGIAIDGNTISTTSTSTTALEAGTGITIHGNTISVEPNLQTINALPFAADKLIRITGATTADLIDFNMGLYTPVATIIANVASVSPLESMYFNIGLLVGVFGRVNIDPSSGSSNSTFIMSIPIASNFANPRDAVGTASSGVLNARIQADPATNKVIFTVYAPGSSSGAADFSFVFWYRVL